MNRQKMNALIVFDCNEEISECAGHLFTLLTDYCCALHKRTYTCDFQPSQFHTLACVFDKIYYFNLLLTNVHTRMNNTLKWQMLKQA